MLRLLDADKPRLVAPVTTVAAFNLVAGAKRLKLVALDNLTVSVPYRFIEVEALKLTVPAPAFKVVPESPIIGERALKSVVAVARIFGADKVTAETPESVRSFAFNKASVVALKWKLLLSILREVAELSIISPVFALR